MIKINKLRGRIVENDLSVAEVAQKMDINRSTLYRKMKDGTFTVGDVQRLSEILNLSSQDVTDIFFSQGVA